MVDQICERMQVHISAKLDGELTELEAAELSKHLARCFTCAVAEVELRRSVEILRIAPVSRPERTIAIPHRTSSRRTHTLVAVVAAAAFAAIGVLPAQGPDRYQRALTQSQSRAAYVQSIDYELGLVATARAARRADQSPVTAV